MNSSTLSSVLSTVFVVYLPGAHSDRLDSPATSLWAPIEARCILTETFFKRELQFSAYSGHSLFAWPTEVGHIPVKGASTDSNTFSELFE